LTPATSIDREACLKQQPRIAKPKKSTRINNNNDDRLRRSYGAGGGSSPQPRASSHSHGAADDLSDSKSQRDYERESSKSREKERSRDRDRERDKDRERSKDRDREKDKDRHHRDRDRHRDRSDRRERGRDRDDDDYHRSRDYDRRSREYDRDDRHRRRSRSRSKGRSEHRSRSRSRSRSKRSDAWGKSCPPGNVSQHQFGALPVMPVQAMTQQATRHARRVYVGGLPPTANEQSVATFFSQVMAAIGGNTAGPGDAVVNVYINHEKKFAFVEMRSVEEASNAMALDGIIFEGAPVKVRRPSDYNPSLAATLGPSQPNPNLNLAAVGLTPGSAGGLEGPDRIFVGGLPYYFTEVQIRELLESFGPLRGFDLVKDRETGNSKGYAFCVYQDLSVTDIACAALNGIKMGDKTLTVRRANQGANQPKPEQENVLLHAQQQIALQLRDDEEYEDILEDIRTEAGKFGALVNVVIPRPRPDGQDPPGVGKVFLEYADTEGSQKARSGMNGRKFGGNQVVATFFAENKFYEGELCCYKLEQPLLVEHEKPIQGRSRERAQPKTQFLSNKPHPKKMASSLPLRHLRRLSTATSTSSSSFLSISQAKSKLRYEHDPDKALEICSSVSQLDSSPAASRQAQVLAVRRLASSGRFSDIESFIESQKSNPNITQEPFLCSLIRSYGLAGMFDHAFKTYQQMDHLGTPRTSLSFNALLSACNQCKNFDKVPVLFADVSENFGVLPDKVSYGILVKSYCEAGKPEKAAEVLREMGRKGVEVTNVTFTTVLDCWYKNGKSEEAESLWGEMLSKGCKLDAAAYNVKLRYIQFGEPEKLEKLLDEMADSGIRPDTISFNCLMTSYLEKGMVEDGRKVYDGLKKWKCNPNVATFRILISYLCRNEKFEEGYRIFKESVKVHKIPDFDTLKVLVEGLVAKKKKKEAKGLIRTMKKKCAPNFLDAWKRIGEDLFPSSTEDSSDRKDEEGEEVAAQV
ncbi:hypothetical protein Tsubulata_033465, partial [Turnera subulata]